MRFPNRGIGVGAAILTALLLLTLFGTGEADAQGTLVTPSFIIAYNDGDETLAATFGAAGESVADGVASFLSVEARDVPAFVYSRPEYGIIANAFGGCITAGIPPAPSALSLGWTPAQLEYVAAHELTHVLLARALPNASVGVPGAFPAWLEEGLANYLGGLHWPSVNATSRGLMKYLLDHSSVDDIDGLFSPSGFAATQGSSLITYLIDSRGTAKFHEFLADLDTVQSCCDVGQVNATLDRAYGADSAELTASWHSWLRDVYTAGYAYAGVSFPRLALFGGGTNGPEVPGSWRGNLVAFSSSSPASDVCVAFTNVTDGRCSPSLLGLATDPRISPDATRVLLTAHVDAHFDLFLWYPDGTTLRLTNDSYIDVAGSWAPGGQDVLFSSTRSGNWDVWRLHLASMTFERVTTEPSDEFSPALSPDGTRIAFVSNRSGRHTVYVADPSGNGASPLWPDGPDLRFPDWSPDGTKVVAAMTGPDYAGIAEMGVAYAGRAVVVNLSSGVDASGNAPWAGFPIYSANGTEIVFSDREDLRLVESVLHAPAAAIPLWIFGVVAIVAVVAILVLLWRRIRRRRPGNRPGDAVRP